jgi:GNAT superfamily N-acetyltransferase
MRELSVAEQRYEAVWATIDVVAGDESVRGCERITVPGHRRQGHGTILVLDVVAWARSVAADRVDLSATPAGSASSTAAGVPRTRKVRPM